MSNGKVSKFVSMRMFGRITAAIVIFYTLYMLYAMTFHNIKVENTVENILIIVLTAAVMYLWNQCDKAEDQ